MQTVFHRTEVIKGINSRSHQDQHIPRQINKNCLEVCFVFFSENSQLLRWKILLGVNLRIYHKEWKKNMSQKQRCISQKNLRVNHFSKPEKQMTILR